AHVTTVDMSLRYLVMPQLLAVRDAGGEAVGISAPGPWVPELEAAGIRHIPLESSTRGVDPLADLRAARELWRILRREKFDVLHTHNPKPGLYGRVLGRLAKVPIVVNTVHGLYATPDDSALKRAIVYSLEAIASRFSDGELIQNPEDADLLRRWRIAPRRRVELLGNGVDLERFRPGNVTPDERRDIRSGLGLDDSHVAVGIVARLVAEKGYPELFAAACKLPEPFVLVVVGPHDPDKADSLPQSLLDQAAECRVQFLGMRDDVDRLYGAMDLFVLPSHREGFPRAAMEAAASGLPVVATDIRGCRQVVDPGHNGLLVPVRDSAALADAITEIGKDAARMEAMAAASRVKAETDFDERAVVAKVMESYDRIAHRKGLRLLPANSDIEYRTASDLDAAALGRLHAESITEGFLPSLGSKFMSRLYSALIAWPDADVIVADDGSGPVGYVAGVADTGAFYKHFAKRHGLPAAAAAGYRLAKPKTLRRAFETLSYDGGEVDVAAELLAMAVAREARGSGLGTELGTRLLERFAARGIETARVVVGAANSGAIGLYGRLGFEFSGRIEVHSGAQSELMVWQR
ncbi:MAG: GNAT family N-acetyltransferase, partial [Acidimicrobiia bacterium]|nr:GNAT family N-acetyltransferase [Acidimicrobiia bacterium]